MTQPTSIGTNRTGIQASPIDGKKLEEYPRQRSPTSDGDERGIARQRIEYAKQGVPIGTMPPPGSMKGVATSAMQALKGEKATVFLDKIGERLAFERTGVRLYDALLSKFDAFGSWDGGPARGDLERFREEELKHFELLRRSMEQLGADPTAVTPSADVAAMVGMGITRVLVDPRTNLRASMDAILAAELVDHACWEVLVGMARAVGQDEMANSFEVAEDEEDRHLVSVKRWLTQGIGADLGVEIQPPPPAP